MGLMPKGIAPPQNDQESDVVGDEEGFEEATPDEQADYEGVVFDAMEMIYSGGEVKPGILKLLDDDPTDLKEALGGLPELEEFSPVVALAAATVVIVLEIVRKAGAGEIEDAAILHGGKTIMEELAMVADTAGIHEFSEEELNKAFLIGLDLYRDAAESEGLLDTTQLKEEFEQIKAADAQGAFGQQPEQVPNGPVERM